MSNDFICRTKEINATRHSCFSDDHGDCIAVTIEECGLDLEGMPENEQTKKLFEAARMTGLATILSVADAMTLAKETVLRDFYGDHFHPAGEAYDEIYKARVQIEADRFYEDAKVLIQKMQSGHPFK